MRVVPKETALVILLVTVLPSLPADRTKVRAPSRTRGRCSAGSDTLNLPEGYLPPSAIEPITPATTSESRVNEGLPEPLGTDMVSRDYTQEVGLQSGQKMVPKPVAIIVLLALAVGSWLTAKTLIVNGHSTESHPASAVTRN